MINENLLNIHKGDYADIVELNYAKIGVSLNEADIDYILNDILRTYRRFGAYAGARRVRNCIQLIKY